MKKLIILCLILTVTVVSSQSGLNNMSFENWTQSANGPAPSGWWGFMLTQKTIGAHNGNSYCELKNSSTSVAALFLGQFSSSFGLPGEPLNKTPQTLTGFYRATGFAQGDAANIGFYARFKGQGTAAGNTIINGNQANWTSFAVDIIAFSSGCDTITITVHGPTNSNGVTSGATLDLDNFALVESVGIDDRSIGSGFVVYPNPSSGKLFIETLLPDVVVSLFSVDGRLLMSMNIHSGKSEFDLKELSSGIYYYSLSGKNQIPLTGKLFVN